MSETSSTPLAVSQEVLNSVEQGLRVEFHWTGDRFSHTVLGVRQGQAVPLLESIEGIPSDSFPPSPALVELHQQEEAIFLTGATDAGHWSMSVEPLRLGEEVGFLFDVACRVKSPTEGLTSCYRNAEPANASHCDSSLILGTTCGDFRLESLMLPGAEEQPSCQLTLVEDETRLIRKIHEASALPQTVRWQYRLIG